MGVLAQPQSNMDENPETDEVIQPQQDDVRSNDVTSHFHVGLKLDVKDSVGVWAEAEIMKIDLAESAMYVTFTYWGDRWDEWISMNDTDRIADLHMHTYIEGHNPGSKLKLNQRIEVRDSRGKWLETFVIEITPNEVKVHYKGYHPKFDEWLDRSTSRIRSFGRCKQNLGDKQVVQMRRWQVPVVPDSAHPHKVSTGTSEYAQDRERYHRQGNDSGNPEVPVEVNEYTGYLAALARRNLSVQPMEGDGNCLFRSVSHQLYGSDEFHGLVREKCMDYMLANSSFFSQFVVDGAASFHLYIAAKRRDGVWGDDPEIQAICELYSAPCEIWAFDNNSGARKLRTFHENVGAVSSSHGQQERAIRLSYYGGGHYDSVTILPTHSHRGFLVEAPGLAEDRAIKRCHATVAESDRLKEQEADMASAVRVSMEHSESAERQRAEQEIVGQVLEESRRALMQHLCYDEEAAGDGSDQIRGQGGGADVEQEFLLWCVQSEEHERRQKLRHSDPEPDRGSASDAKTAGCGSGEDKKYTLGGAKTMGKSVKDLYAVDGDHEEQTEAQEGKMGSLCSTAAQAKDGPTAGLSDVEGDLMSSVLQSSEREFLEQQLGQFSTPVALSDAEREERDLRLAMEMSRDGEVDETERAIQESMRSFSAGASSSSATGHRVANADRSVNEDYDEDLYLAIQASLGAK